MSTRSLQDRNILITGATGGIGREAAFSCAQEGATVLLLGRNEKKLSNLYDELVSAGLPTPAILPMNLLQITPDLASDLVTQLQAEFGQLDGLLHCACELGTLTPIELYSPEQWLKVMQVNLNAPFVLTQALLPLLKTSQDASIVFSSADVGINGRAYWGAYGVSKFGIEGLAQILADELEANTNIRVNVIDPMRARTKLRAKAYPAEVPTDNPEPKSLMATYLDLLGPKTQSVTGQRFTIHAQTVDKA